jgi:hypothetical protein
MLDCPDRIKPNGTAFGSCPSPAVGCRFFECDIDRDSDDFLTVSGELVENKLKAGLLGIKNTSEKIWSVKFPDESVRDVPPGNGFPVWPGLEIDFGGGVQAKI